MTEKIQRKGKPIVGISSEVAQLKPDYSEFELTCDYRYIRAIIRAGGIPLILPVNQDPYDIKSLVHLIDGIMIIGGADIEPAFYGERARHKIKPMYQGRTHFDISLYRTAHRRKIPVLAICYGMQLLNVIYGGTLYQDIQKQILGSKNHRSKRDPLHLIHLENGSELAKILGKKEFLVHSHHHQAVKQLGRSLRAVGHSPDWIVEAIEGPPKTLAVQWHPERQGMDRVQRRLFNHFVKLCKERK